MSHDRIHLIRRDIDTPLGKLLLISFSTAKSIDPSVLFEYVLGVHLRQLIGRKNYNFYRTLSALKINRIPAKPIQMARLRAAGLVGSMVNQVSLIHANDALRLIERTAQRQASRPTVKLPVLFPDTFHPLSSRSFHSDDSWTTMYPSTLPTLPGKILPPLRMILPLDCWGPLPDLSIPVEHRPIFGPHFWDPSPLPPPPPFH